MAEDVQLSFVQTEKLLQFQDLTGIEDIERCRSILENHSWDIEVAVQDTLNMREGTPSVFRPPPPSPPPVVTHPPDQRVYHAVRPWQPRGLFDWGYFLLSIPFSFAYSIFLSITRFALSLIRPDPRRIVADPLGDVFQFIREFERQYGTNHPVFYQGTYSQALNDAKQELRFLLVYLHGDDHQDTDEFCRSTLGSANLINFINTSMLFWACSVKYPEGYREGNEVEEWGNLNKSRPTQHLFLRETLFSQALRENTYPFLAVIVLRDNRMTAVARLEGPTESDVLIRRLQLIMNDNEASLIAARLERQERSLNQTLRQQQDEAYEESLRADQEKERRRREVQEQKNREEMERREREIAEQRRKEEIRRQKIELATQIPDEPTADSADTIRLMIKLPVGTRLERRFNKNDSLKHLYYFVFCHEESPDSFQIVTNFPRRILPCEPSLSCPEPPTFAEAGLGNSEMVFVQDLEA